LSLKRKKILKTKKMLKWRKIKRKGLKHLWNALIPQCLELLFNLLVVHSLNYKNHSLNKNMLSQMESDTS